MLLRVSMAALSAVLLVLDLPLAIAAVFFLLTMLFFQRAGAAERLFLAGAFFLYAGVAHYHEAHHGSLLKQNQTDWLVVFTDHIQVDGDRLRAEVREAATNEKLRFSYRIKSEQEKRLLQQFVKPGLSCRVQAKAALPRKARNAGAFDEQNYLSAQNIFYTLSPETIFLQNCVVHSSLKYKPAQWRAAAIKHIEQRFPEPLRSTAAALLFGDRSRLSDETKTSYERLGVVHLLAISGLHVTMLAGFCFYLLIRTGATREQARLLLIAALPLYTLLTGAAPPVVRACLMSGLLLAAGPGGKVTAADALGGAFLLMLFFHPHYVLQPGFQLSFAVAFSLVLSAGFLVKQAVHPLKLSFFISLAAQLASFPLLMYHFKEVSLISPLANLLFVPFYSLFLLPLTLILFSLSFLISVDFGLNAANYLLNWLNQFAVWLSDFSWAVWVTGQPGLPVVAFAIIGVLAAFLYWETSGNVTRVLLAFFAGLALLFMLPFFSSKGEVTFLDVGQGDSIFIQLPFNQGTYLIDTGGQFSFSKPQWAQRSSSFSVGTQTLVPFLKQKGVRKLDKLIITHADFDHAGAAAEVLAEVPADEIIVSPGSAAEPLLKQLAVFGHPIKEAAAGTQWKAGNAQFQFLSPRDSIYEGNNDSLVLYAEIGGKTWLFTGDLEEEGERQLIQHYSLTVDWLKVGHHGSSTSTSLPFIQTLQPKNAVVSAGANNRYGHPHRDVMQRLAKAGTRIYRTDLHGSISYVFKGERGFVSTALEAK